MMDLSMTELSMMELIWTGLHDLSPQAKRVRLKRYAREEHGHDCFRLRSGRVCEGYILRIEKEALVFVEAFSPIFPVDDPDQEAIPLADIVAVR